MRLSLHRVLSSLSLLALSVSATVHARGDDDRRSIPIVFHVAHSEGKPVADDAFLASELEHANIIYRELGLELVRVSQDKLAQRHARIVERRDRDALGALLEGGVINVFIVGCLMDVDEPGRERRGVHWRVRNQRQRHFVIVSAISGPYVLAHELGHFFGNPEHSDVPGNLMSYQQTDAVPVLDPDQRNNVARTLESLFSSGELRAPSAARRTKKPVSATRPP
jgi:hypothetical protein